MGVLYTDLMRKLKNCGITKVSRKGMDPSALTSSVVKWKCGSFGISVHGDSSSLKGNLFDYMLQSNCVHEIPSLCCV